MDEQNNVLPKDKMVSMLQQEYEDSIAEIESLLPFVGHGEIKRIFMAELRHPKEDTDFTSDKLEVGRIFAAAKRAKDALVGLATEAVIERLIKQQMASNEATEAPAEEVKND